MLYRILTGQDRVLLRAQVYPCTRNPNREVTTMSRVLLRRPEVMRRTSLKTTTLYSLVGQGLFPRQARINGRNVAWYEDEVDLWIETRPRTLPCQWTEHGIEPVHSTRASGIESSCPEPNALRSDGLLPKEKELPVGGDAGDRRRAQRQKVRRQN